MTPDNPSSSNAPRLSFTAFVLSLAHSAAIHFGDLAAPGEERPSEPNLEGASQMIEILDLLQEKTRGNLSAEERSVLEQVLYELRMRYVQADKQKRVIVEP